MAILEQIQKNDFGTVIRVTVQDLQANGSTLVLDVSAATTAQFILRKPSGAKLTKTTSFTTDGTDGNIEYTTIAGDMSESGDWKLQVYLIFPTGSWRTDIGSFNVCDNL